MRTVTVETLLAVATSGVELETRTVLSALLAFRATTGVVNRTCDDAPDAIEGVVQVTVPPAAPQVQPGSAVNTPGVATLDDSVSVIEALLAAFPPAAFRTVIVHEIEFLSAARTPA